MPMQALEMESLVPEPSSPRSPPRRTSSRRLSSSLSLSSVHNANCTALTPRRYPTRVRSFVTVVCCLVGVALIFNLFGSMEMIDDSFLDDESDKLANGPPYATLQPDDTTPGTPPSDGSGQVATASPTDAPAQQVTTQTGRPTSWKPPYPAGGGSTATGGSWFGPSNTTAGWTPRPPPPPDKNASQIFVDRWCDLQGADWYPEDDKEWQLRAPYFIIPGAKSSGTAALASYLHDHAHVVPARSKELSFFFEANFRRYVTASEKTKVLSARKRMLARDYSEKGLIKDPQLISFDATPGYLFYSTLLPRRMFCVIPWVKLVILLRDPVDRLWDHYLISQQKYRLRDSFDYWIDKDFEIMRKVGLLNETSSFAGSPDEDMAWYEYQTKSLAGSVGRGLYVIQLRQWFQALRAMGRDPSSQVLLLQTELLQDHPAEQYRRVLQFLNLQDELPSQFSPPAIVPPTQVMSNTTRQRLQAFYQPYNNRLNLLLRQYGLAMA